MANTSLNISSLDFDTLKQNLKNYLSSQSVFKDYDFEGSNINVLLDVLTYNSYLNSFYMNMVASEMFLDSAQKYDSVISHAKELNYVPISATSSYANVNITFETSGLSGSLYMPKGTRFSGRNANNSYEFVTQEPYYSFSSNDTFTISNVVLYEGSYFQDSFIYDTTQENLLLRLSNENLDVNSLTVTVIENNGANTTIFTKADNLFGLDKNSEVFFVQGSDNNRYEIVFGDNILGRKPQHLSTILAEYRVVNAEDADGISDFGMSDELSSINNGQVTVSNITAVFSSRDGASQENIDSIKFNAPRHFAAQYRAIASDDYASIILSRFGGKIDDVIIYGGQELEPKLYGRVVVSLKPVGGTFTTESLKNEISNYLLDYIALPNRVLIKDPEDFYCHVISTVQYNTKTGKKSVNELKTLLSQEILDFSSEHLEKFGDDFRYSKFTSHIDAADINITSNDTQARILKKITPNLNTPTSFVIDFNNETEARRTYCSGIYHDSVVLTTCTFTYVDSSGTEYTSAQIKDDGNGNLVVFRTINNVQTIINSNIGSIDYTTGKVLINNLKTSYYSNYITVLVNTKNKDIIASRNMILYLAPEFTTINIIETLK